MEAPLLEMSGERCSRMRLVLWVHFLPYLKPLSAHFSRVNHLYYPCLPVSMETAS